MNTTYDKILAVIALSLFVAFCAIIVIWVMEWDLKIVLLIAIGMAAYDFWQEAFKKKSNERPTTHADGHDKQHDGI